MQQITIYNQNQITTPGAVTSVATFDKYLASIDRSPKTIETYKRGLKRLFNFFSFHRITEPQEEDLIQYKHELEADGYKPSTQQTYIVALRRFFEWTERKGIYPNIARYITGVKLDRDHKKDHLTSAQTRDLLESIDRTTDKGKRDYAMILLMITGGLRTIEVTRANIEDLTHAGDIPVIYLQSKGKKERTDFVRIPAETERALREYLMTRKNRDGREPLFTSASNRDAGERMTTRSVSRVVKECLKGAGLDSDRLTAHSLRHTAVTLALLAGKGIDEVKGFARHQNIETTLIYAHHLKKEKNDCADAIANMIFTGATA